MGKTENNQEAAFTNRLIHSTSPYLLQHARNPVDWYPWGEEAFAKSRKEGKPIFLSVGYSACHWCHVMERESFENGGIAEILNDHFVSIKVDREERPDVDAIYMDAVQMMTRSGGWPMSVFLTSDLEPFFAGTYFPPVSKYGQPGFKELLISIHDAWENNRERLNAGAAQVIGLLRRQAAGQGPDAGVDLPDGKKLDDVSRQALAGFDPVFGGFGDAPKFPAHGTVELLFRRYHATGDADALQAGLKTLERMACGGIYDQLGGGFHRYSVDARWLVPHFEKMLYDNALLAPVYLDAWQITGDPFYRRIAEETLDFLIREMRDESGAFHSTLDADSEGEEGKFYIWSPAEIDALLSAESAELLRGYYGVTRGGNFEGENILNITVSPGEFAKKRGLTADAFSAKLDAARAILLEARADRVWPGKDDKCLTAWNGLAVTAFARGYAVLGNDSYRKAAEGVTAFIQARMLQADGSLLRSYRQGKAAILAYLDDYAYLCRGLVELFLINGDVATFELAEKISTRMIADFADPGGGFFFSSEDHRHLIVRRKEYIDQAIPAPGLVATEALYLLDRLRGTDTHGDFIRRTLTAAVKNADRYPTAFTSTWNLADRLSAPGQDIVLIASAPGDPLRGHLQKVYLPNALVLSVQTDQVEALADRVPIVRSRPAVDGKPTAYVCRDHACLAPVTDVEDFKQALNGLSSSP